MYWHSELFKEKNYHFNKLKNTEEKNIRLITVFEHEWLTRKQIEGFIKSSLGIFSNRIYGRNCIVKEIEHPIDFFNNYHIFGCSTGVSHSYGLFLENELLGAISYGHHHRLSEKFCLKRLAFKDNIQVIGGASKLIKNSIRQIPYDKVITWSDNRWSTGELYRKIGFILEDNIRPDYIYYN